MTNYSLKQAKVHFWGWVKSEIYSLDCCYQSYSGAKARAWARCLKWCNDYEGSNLRVITYNTNVFTAGFSYVDKQTGEKMFMYISPSFHCAIPFSEI